MNMSKIDGRDKMDGSLNIYNRISGIVSARVNAMEKHAREAVAVTIQEVICTFFGVF